MRKLFLLLCIAPTLLTSGELRKETQQQNLMKRAVCPLSLHKATHVFKTEQTVILEDGSQWAVSYGDSATLSTWRSGDSVSILPNYAWFTNFSYLLVNENNQSKIQVNLVGGPSLFNPACCWITHIEENHLFLQNGMMFCVNLKDEINLKQWSVNDPIIFGTEDSAWTHYPYILINVNTNDHIRATQH